MTEEIFDIVITTNSPGELYSFVRPAVKALHERLPKARIILVITPCQYASGREIEVARSFSEIYEIVLPQEFNSWIYRHNPPKGITFSKKGVVLFLGGDLLHALMLAKNLHYPATAYSMHRLGWKRHFLRFFLPDEWMARKAKKARISASKVKIVGDLMADAVSSQALPQDLGLDPERPIITFMPGSRMRHTRFLAPFFLKTAEEIRKSRPETQFVFALSPFTNFLRIEESVEYGKMDRESREFGLPGELVIEGGRKSVVSANGTKIYLAEKAPHDAMNAADLIVTIPGTNTAEAAYLGKPMLVVVPFNKPEALLFDGLAGLLGSAPVIGKLIKKAAIFVSDKFNKFSALPNRKAQRFVVPELRGILKAEDVAGKAIGMLCDKKKLQEISEELKSVMGEKGAAARIAEEIEHILIK